MLSPAVPAVVAVIVTVAPLGLVARIPTEPTLALKAATIFAATVAAESATPAAVVTPKYSTPPLLQEVTHCCVIPPLSVVPDHAKFVAVPFESAIVLPPAPIVEAVRFTTPEPPLAAVTPTLLPSPATPIAAIRFVASVAATPVTTKLPAAGPGIVPLPDKVRPVPPVNAILPVEMFVTSVTPADCMDAVAPGLALGMLSIQAPIIEFCPHSALLSLIAASMFSANVVVVVPFPV